VPEALGQTRDHSAHLSRQQKGGTEIIIGDVGQSACENQMRFSFHQGAVRDGEMVNVLSKMLAPLPFCDICGNRNRCSL
jgi:hypothetical protein